MTHAGRARRARRTRAVAIAALVAYVPLIAVSWMFSFRAERAREAARDKASPLAYVTVDTSGGETPRALRLAYREMSADGQAKGVVLLLHGTPGDSSNFQALMPMIAAGGYRVIAIDRPGFGASSRDVASHSPAFNAGAASALLMQHGVERAHVVAWSSSGPVAISMAMDSPIEVESVTLLGATADQRAEGSGSYYFEHAKYRVGEVALSALYYLVPHFGVVPHDAVTWIYDFIDLDLRESGRDLRTLDVPVLVLQGRSDFLVKDWAAERHHVLNTGSRLVVYDGDHFAPFMAPDAIAPHMLAFFDAAREGNKNELGGQLILAPREEPLGWVGARVRETTLWLPWYAEVLMVGVLAWRTRRFSLALAALWVASGSLDLGVAMLGVFCASLVRTGRAHPRGVVARVRDAAGDVALLFGLRLAAMFLAEPLIAGTTWAGLAVMLVVLVVLTYVLPAPWTTRSRQRFLAWLRRLRKYEYWPSHVFYAPPLAYGLVRSIGRGGPGVVTRCNPAISHGGGVISETKSEILGLLREAGAPILPFEFIAQDADEEARFARAIGLIHSERLGGFPVVLKPDSGMRGYAMRIARDEHDVRAYVREMPRDFVAQKYHAGPHECSVFWVRDGSQEHDGWIFSITRKEFPYLVGDGKRTVEELIWAHPRFRCQAAVYSERLSDQLTWEPAPGEGVPLVRSGNHAQGAIFHDGSDLITPALTRAFAEIVRAIPARDGRPEGFDIGRFDVRYEDEAELRDGRGIAIVELNGVTSESTNLYDPSRSVWWAWAIAFRHVRLLIDIGAWRRSQGYQAMSLRELLLAHREHHADLPNLHVAD